MIAKNFAGIVYFPDNGDQHWVIKDLNSNGETGVGSFSVFLDLIDSIVSRGGEVDLDSVPPDEPNPPRGLSPRRYQKLARLPYAEVAAVIETARRKRE